MHARATDGLSIADRLVNGADGDLVLGLTERLAAGWLPATEQLAVEDDRVFVVREVLGLAIRALFENDDVESCRGEFPGDDAACGARADDGEIDGLNRRVRVDQKTRYSP